MKAIGKDKDYFKDTILTADMGYHSGENIKRCEEESIDAYIPDKNYRKRHPNLGVKHSSIKVRRMKFMPEDFSYDEKTDEYEWPAGKKLKRHTRSYNRRWGTMYVAYRAEKGDCEVCTQREGCISKKGKKMANESTSLYQLNQNGEITHKRWQRKWTPSGDGRYILTV